MTDPKIMSMLLAASLLVLVATPAAADDDHDQARHLYESGHIRGLSEILRRATSEVPGDVVGVDLVQKGPVWIYRIDIVDRDGHRQTIELRASNDGDDGDAGGAPTGSAGQ